MKMERWAFIGMSSSAPSRPPNPVRTSARTSANGPAGSSTRWSGGTWPMTPMKNVGQRGGTPSLRSKISAGKVLVTPPSTITESWPVSWERNVKGV